MDPFVSIDIGLALGPSTARRDKSDISVLTKPFPAARGGQLARNLGLSAAQ
jgi:hypothetical protein